jgi:chorismate mutase
VRRYQAPDEYPFFPDVLQQPLLSPVAYPHLLHANDVNVNPRLHREYIDRILPTACGQSAEQPENYGSAATADVQCLQALSRRVHFGKFVAEVKFRAEPERFARLIRAHDTAGIDAAITDAAVEKKVLERLRLKAKTYGTDPSLPAGGKIDVEAVVAMYENIVIPLTKLVEVDYLMQRLVGTEWEHREL